MADDTTLSELRSMFTAARRTASSDTAPSGSSLDSAVAHEMRLNRQAGQSKTAGSNISLSAPRPADPRFYWQNSRLPYDFSKGDHVRDMREICRMVTSTHPTVGSVIDTYATYPLAGMEMVCPKSPEIADFYQQLFIDQLHYDEFLIDAGKEYWKVGEAFPYATFNELLGTWESDELMLPEDTKVVKSPFLMEPRLEMKLPAYIRKIIIERKPQQEYVKLITAYPELVAYARAGESMLSINDEDDDPRVWIPVSNMVMSHIKLSTDHFNPRGVSIIMRALRSLVQEEKLNSAQEAIADRLYTPFILARIGASATDLGTKAPWIPTTGDLDAFLDDMNAALAGDFRLAVHHFAVQIDNVFGRETIPDLTSDFERLEGKILQAFGMSKTMLSGACLTGDTMIRVRRAGKSFTMPIEMLVDRFNGNDDNLPARKWSSRPDIDTFVARADGDFVRVGQLAAAYRSGVKQVFLLMTENGRSIRASKDHPFLRADGEWVRLEDLEVGDEVQVNMGEPARPGVSRRPAYRTTYTWHHPYQIRRGYRDGEARFSVLTHRLVMEAHLNGLGYDEFVRIIRNDEARSKELIYLDPAIVHVHHVDEDRQNNVLSNLAVLPVSEHMSLHADPEMVWWRIGTDRIISIEACGEEMTYDLTMMDEPHNFIASDFVVHNSSGETYAADAMNRDLLTQLLTTFQKRMKRFVKTRAAVVAEAQGHYDFDMKGGRAVPIMEEVVVTDDEGNKRIERRPKLLLPDLRIRSMNMKDEDNLHALLEALRESGVPISMRSRLVNIPIDLEEEVEATRKEQVAQAVAAQEARRDTYIALKQKGLPIPEDLRADFEPKVIVPGEQQQPAGADIPLDTIGITAPAPTTGLAPSPEQIQSGEIAGVDQSGGESTLQRLPRNRVMELSNRVPESDEQRAGMPKAAALFSTAKPSVVWRDGVVGGEVIAMDDRIQMVGRLIDEGGSVTVEEVPVLGSWLTRHVGIRDEAFFFLNADTDAPA